MDTKEFLMRWLMEFGTEPVIARTVLESGWYAAQHNRVQDLPEYFSAPPRGMGLDGTYMKPEALLFIRGE